MTSKIKVDSINKVSDDSNIINKSGTDITMGQNGDTVIIPNGVTEQIQSGGTIQVQSGGTLTIASGATLANSGTATGFASIAWQSSIVTAATHTAAAGQGLWLDTSSNAITLTLPASPSVGDQIIFTDYARNWATNAVTININSLNFQGGTTNPVYDTNGQSVDIVYSGATKGWIPNSDDDVANEGTLSFNIEYLLVAGGGSGAGSNAGGGGGGGVLTNYTGTAISFLQGSTYTATVGGGGAASAAGSNPGINGTNSVLSGSGIATVTALGGGGSGYGGSDGLDGGSGGGGGYNAAGGNGTVGQGNDGGLGVATAPAYGAGGGGGAGAVGVAGTSNSGGNGGNGLANSITGAAITYAGGGGGTTDPGHPQGTGGTGGGGAGVVYGGGTATSGTNGLGGGGGGAGGGGATAGAGGDGVVILRIATASYTGTVTGSPTVSTDGTDTIIKFTGTGTYTA